MKQFNLNKKNKILLTVFSICIGISLVLFLSFSVKIIDFGYVGIVRYQGKLDLVLVQEGMHFINPFSHTIEIIDLRPKVKFSSHSIQLSENNDISDQHIWRRVVEPQNLEIPKINITFEQVPLEKSFSSRKINITACIQYYVDKSKLSDVFHAFQNVQDLDDRVIVPAINSSLRLFDGTYSRTTFLHKVKIGLFQNKMEKSTRQEIGKILEKYHLEKSVIVIFRVDFKVNI